MEPSGLGVSSAPGDFYIRSGLGGSALGSRATELQCKMKPLIVEVSEQEGAVGSKVGHGTVLGSPRAENGQRQPSRWGVNLMFAHSLIPPLLSPGTGVTVNALHPGVARTELGRHTGMHSSAFSSFTLGKNPPGLRSLS